MQPKIIPGLTLKVVLIVVYLSVNSVVCDRALFTSVANAVVAVVASSVPIVPEASVEASVVEASVVKASVVSIVVRSVNVVFCVLLADCVFGVFVEPQGYNRFN